MKVIERGVVPAVVLESKAQDAPYLMEW